MSNKEMGTEDALCYLKKEKAALEQERDALEQQVANMREYIAKLELDIEEKNEEMRGLYVAACLKFGTWTSPLAMEMVLPLRNTERATAKGYGLTISDRVDRNERTVRVVKLWFGVC